MNKENPSFPGLCHFQFRIGYRIEIATLRTSDPDEKRALDVLMDSQDPQFPLSILGANYHYNSEEGTLQSRDIAGVRQLANRLRTRFPVDGIEREQSFP